MINWLVDRSWWSSRGFWGKDYARLTFVSFVFSAAGFTLLFFGPFSEFNWFYGLFLVGLTASLLIMLASVWPKKPLGQALLLAYTTTLIAEGAKVLLAGSSLETALYLFPELVIEIAALFILPAIALSILYRLELRDRNFSFRGMFELLMNLIMLTLLPLAMSEMLKSIASLLQF